MKTLEDMAKEIRAILTDSEILEQASEELHELQHAVSKLQRLKSEHNKPCGDPAQIVQNFNEEIADVLNCIEVLSQLKEYSGYQIEEMRHAKLDRWVSRLAPCSQPAEPPKSERRKILQAAIQAVCSDRNMQYGEPEDNFARIADYWSYYLGVDVSSFDVSMMMVLFKVARVQTAAEVSEDALVDIAGYAACASECLR